MISRWLRTLACTGLLGCLLHGCNVYDAGVLDPQGGRGAGDGGRGGSAGDGPDACVASEEVCNGVDDDCNGIVDDAEPARDDCSTRYHANVSCGRGGICVFISSNPMCHPGWYHCDGLPQTGCESSVPCCTNGDCPDAGEDDAGADDAGADP